RGAVPERPGPVAAAMGTMDDEDLLDYFRMEYRWNILHLKRKLRQAEEDSLSVFICLQEKRKEAKRLQEALEVKEDFKERMEAVVCCWQDLHTQAAELKTHTEESLSIAKEYDKMRVQALKTATRKREKKVQKELELLRAKRKLEVWRNKHEKLYNKVQKYSIFKRYLEDVVKISQASLHMREVMASRRALWGWEGRGITNTRSPVLQFADIQEVISPYKMLMRVLRDLEQLQERHKEKSEQARVLVDQYIAEKEAEILQYKHKLVELQQRFDQAKEDVQFWETRWADIQETSPKKALELGTIRMAILNLFQSANRKMNTKLNVPVDGSHRQLNRIQQCIQDLADISMEVKEDIQNHQRAAVPTGHGNVRGSARVGRAGQRARLVL
ncbi:coiled-coil domain-containing protein 42, partial [Neopsephotus bourkii]|uniref:coiled-coil domain-containing protein 42 n=1 Tax=Neopsephotus bourkii TaxID=309878 RepID=UPI002AA5DB38